MIGSNTPGGSILIWSLIAIFMSDMHNQLLKSWVSLDKSDVYAE